MKRYALLAGAIGVVLLATFVGVKALGWDVLQDPRPALARFGILAPLASFALLAADVFLPVPSSMLMVANGAWFGFAIGTLVSTAGSLAAAALAFAIGRGSAARVARFCTADERRTMERLLARWGPFAIAVTRPVPILAETAALIAGTTSMRWRALTLGAFVGSLPPSAAYAYAGAFVRETSSWLVFGAVLAASAVLFVVGLRAHTHSRGAGGDEQQG